MTTAAIFARTRSPCDLPVAAPPPTPAAIAAAVHRPAAHQVIEHALVEARRLGSDIDAQLQAALAAEGRNGLMSRATRRLADERRAVTAEIRRLRESLVEPRQCHRERVAEALAPLRRVTATELLSALDGLKAAARVLTEIEAEITRAAGPYGMAFEKPQFALPRLGDIEAAARRLAEGAS